MVERIVEKDQAEEHVGMSHASERCGEVVGDCAFGIVVTS